MPALTRRKDPYRHDCWGIYFGDVGVGHIGKRVGVPFHVHPWEWSCGFYPGDLRGVSAGGTSATFDQARADFEAAWAGMQQHIRESDYDEHRRQRAGTAWKYAMHDAGLPLPTQVASGRSLCFCGAEITVRSLSDHIAKAHLEMQ